MQLKEIYRPIEKELIDVERLLRNSLRNTAHKSILRMNNYLLDAGGKKLRPTLVLLSAKAAGQSSTNDKQITKIATAVELIHRASLIHDDVIDHSCLRHNKPTINSKWGNAVSIALGDYLYSVAFELISECGNSDILRCISSATKAMCEGELLQVCERDNLDLSKQRYILIVKNKTAALFAASCQAGSLISGPNRLLSGVLKEYGLNFGIAFQIIDDYLDLLGDEKSLGKSAGQDIKAGEITLPMLYLLESPSLGEREELKMLLSLRKDNDTLQKIKSRLYNSQATLRTKNTVSDYITLAKEKLNILSDSAYKDSLLAMADFIVERGFNAKG